MENKYVRDIIQILRSTNYNKIMVSKSRLSDEEMYFIREVAEQYKKAVIFSSMRDLLFNNDNNVLAAI